MKFVVKIGWMLNYNYDTDKSLCYVLSGISKIFTYICQNIERWEENSIVQFLSSANVRTEVEVVADGTLSIYNLQTSAKMKEEE
jgi:hypothetical protein